jgi:hypothetical protein
VLWVSLELMYSGRRGLLMARERGLAGGVTRGQFGAASSSVVGTREATIRWDDDCTSPVDDGTAVCTEGAPVCRQVTVSTAGVGD